MPSSVNAANASRASSGSAELSRATVAGRSRVDRLERFPRPKGRQRRRDHQGLRFGGSVASRESSSVASGVANRPDRRNCGEPPRSRRRSDRQTLRVSLPAARIPAPKCSIDPPQRDNEPPARTPQRSRVVTCRRATNCRADASKPQLSDNSSPNVLQRHGIGVRKTRERERSEKPMQNCQQNQVFAVQGLPTLGGSFGWSLVPGSARVAGGMAAPAFRLLPRADHAFLHVGVQQCT